MLLLWNNRVEVEMRTLVVVVGLGSNLGKINIGVIGAVRVEVVVTQVELCMVVKI